MGELDRLYVVMYHYTRDLKRSRYPRLKGLDIDAFEKQIAFFVKNFNVVTMEQVIEVWNGDYKLPPNSLLLTFDDGYIDNYTVAFPILVKYGIQGSFFIPGRIINEQVLLDVNRIHFILASIGDDKDLMRDVLREIQNARSEGCEIPPDEELIKKYAVPNRFDTAETIFVKRVLQTAINEEIRGKICGKLFHKYVGIEEKVFAQELYMNRDQVRLMKKDGMFIGLHGYEHYWLGKLDNKQMQSDIDKMLETMGDFIDEDRWVFNYPYGNYNDCVLREIEKRGCVLGMTTECRVADVNSDNRLMIPRLDCNDFPPKSDNYIKMNL